MSSECEENLLQNSDATTSVVASQDESEVQKNHPLTKGRMWRIAVIGQVVITGAGQLASALTSAASRS